MRRISIYTIGLFVLAFCFGVTAVLIESSLMNRLFYTATTLFAVFLFSGTLSSFILKKYFSDNKSRFTAQKIVWSASLIIGVLVISRIWELNAQSILVISGLLTAGVAVALQDVFKNFFGGMTVLLTGLYRIGDRIEVEEKAGDVLNIGVFYTTILEIKQWIDGDQASGRIVLVPNSKMLTTSIHNYTKDHSFIWDEIHIPITYESDWKTVSKILTDIVKKETKNVTEQATVEINKLEEKYYISQFDIEPRVYYKPTDNWIGLYVRYVTPTRERRSTRNTIMKEALEALLKLENVSIASETLIIKDFPDIHMKNA
jgi:small-conductance mechanosensitive channel